MGERNMLVAKFIDNNYMFDDISYDNFGIPIEEDILVLPINENVDFNFMKVKEKVVLLEISEENIVNCQRNSAFHVNKAIPIRSLNNDELSILRSAACQNPELAYYYALNVDQKPTNETRNAACQNPEFAYWYAFYVDQKPTNETRTNSCQNPELAYRYAKYIDQKPINETRNAVSKHPEFAYWYARNIDQKPTPETKKSCFKRSMLQKRI
jgi:hypothetical protein